MVTGFNIDPSSAPDTESTNFPYRKLVGSLMYLACTSRPDIMYSVSYLSRYLDKPNKELVTAGKRILRYLKSTADKGLVYKKGPEKLEAYSDADWAGDRSDRKSTSGSLILYGGNPISWFSKKQTCVALSTAEAEYVAAAVSAQELVNLKGVLSEFSEGK
ncbi:secreted RxLR effector protein 161-like [Harmonia axyridis]|uniref:secreted RxLR effector protein 161-like n=1 Tax=Harmonia axyridis TaxID=115357 RepID=UPI001E276C3E|nr:secreted RxLR effector protein 161-like [Harmonia axyridis]